MTTGIIVRANGAIEDFNGDIDFLTIKPLLNIETIEYVYGMEQGIVAMVDEDAIFKNAPSNLNATFVCDILGHHPHGFVKGDVLFFGGIDGDIEVGLSADQEDRIREILESAIV